jgi:Proteasome assembly chaperone 4
MTDCPDVRLFLLHFDVERTTHRLPLQTLSFVRTWSPFLSATNLSMGTFIVAMPRTKYQGAFSAEAPTSKLISGSDDIQSEMIASQMAERLSQRLKMAVFVSCSLENTPSITGCDGVMEKQMLRSRAGGLAEREVGRLLEERSANKATTVELNME